MPSGENAGQSPLCRQTVRSLKSGLPVNNREIRALFAYFRHFAGTGGGLCLQFRLCGGEAGIRTLGTGVSPYNGLANESFSPPSLVVQHLQSDPTPPSRTQSLSFGSYCAPLCAPDLFDFLHKVRDFRSRLKAALR